MEAYSCHGIGANTTTGGSIPSCRCQARILTTSLQAAMVAYSSDGLRPTLVMGWGPTLVMGSKPTLVMGWKPSLVMGWEPTLLFRSKPTLVMA